MSSSSLDKIKKLFYEFADLATEIDPKRVEKQHSILVKALKDSAGESPEFEGYSLLIKGMINYFNSNFSDSIEECNKAIDILSCYQNYDACGVGYLIAGGSYRSTGELDKAMDYLLKGTEMIPKGSPIHVFQSYCYYQMAEIYNYIMDYESAEENYQIALEIAEKTNNLNALFRLLNGIGNLLINKGELKRGFDCLNKALNIKKLSKSQLGRAYCDIGIYHLKVKNYKLARVNLHKSYDIRVEAGHIDPSSTSLINLAKVDLEEEKYESAEEKLKKALDICLEYNSGIKILDCYHSLARLYENLACFDLSTKYYRLYDEMQLEYNSSRLQNIYTLKNNKIAEQKEIIEESFNSIKESINYARRIQTAILPTEQFILKFLPKAFVFYRPKDIVAGDFYWFEIFEDTVLFAVADCTGHGVPGAMVSVICNNALNRSVREFHLSDPGEILNKTRDLVLEAFKRSEEEMMDGMDIALCSYNKKTKELYYSGAYNPLYLIRNNGNGRELIEFNAHKQPIGRFDKVKEFRSTKVNYEAGDKIYLFSDGYYDQFGGKNGKKLMRKNFKDVIINSSKQDIAQQLQYVESEFDNWRGTYTQTDDVCVMGVEF